MSRADSGELPAMLFSNVCRRLCASSRDASRCANESPAAPAGVELMLSTTARHWAAAEGDRGTKLANARSALVLSPSISAMAADITSSGIPVLRTS
jgi:hypothetical protein